MYAIITALLACYQTNNNNIIIIIAAVLFAQNVIITTNNKHVIKFLHWLQLYSEKTWIIFSKIEMHTHTSICQTLSRRKVTQMPVQVVNKIIIIVCEHCMYNICVVWVYELMFQLSLILYNGRAILFSIIIEYFWFSFAPFHIYMLSWVFVNLTVDIIFFQLKNGLCTLKHRLCC